MRSLELTYSNGGGGALGSLMVTLNNPSVLESRQGRYPLYINLAQPACVRPERQPYSESNFSIEISENGLSSKL